MALLHRLRSRNLLFLPNPLTIQTRATPLPLSSRPEESWEFGPPKVMKNGSYSATTLTGSAALPFVISTEAQRSGEICVQRSPLGNVFRQRNHGPLGPPKVMKNGTCSATTVPASAALPFVISTEAQRSGEICGSAVPPWKCFSTERSAVDLQCALRLFQTLLVSVVDGPVRPGPVCRPPRRCQRLCGNVLFQIADLSPY